LGSVIESTKTAPWKEAGNIHVKECKILQGKLRVIESMAGMMYFFNLFSSATTIEVTFFIIDKGVYYGTA
jgi:hypothetical protein